MTPEVVRAGQSMLPATRPSRRAMRLALGGALVAMIMACPAGATSPVGTPARSDNRGGMPASTAPPAPRAMPAHTVSHGRFVDVPVRMPVGDVQRFVLWFVDGLSAAQRDARLDTLAGDGAMVAMVEVVPLERALRDDGGRCIFGAGDVENFARYVQALYRLPTYRAAIVMGDGEGAALAYAVAAQAPKDTFAGAVSLGFCPWIATGRAMCAGAALRLGPSPGAPSVTLQPSALTLPWVHGVAGDSARCPAMLVERFVSGVPQAEALAGLSSRPVDTGKASDRASDSTEALRVAVRRLGARKAASVPLPPTDLAGLPIVEVPSTPGIAGDTFAVFASGDGGWAGLDKDVAGGLAKAGIPVAGIDSLRYFWTARTPQGFATDLDRIVGYYAQRWGKARVILIGFSQGADVLPAAVARLAPATRQRLQLTALLSIGRIADFEFHVTNWLGGDGDGRPTAPDIQRMDPARTLCLYGEDDQDAICPDLKPGAARVVKLPGDHHFDGDDTRLAREILRAAGQVK